MSLDQLRRFPAADVMVDHARDWLTAIGGQPFFLWLHLMDPHSPYYPRQEGLELLVLASGGIAGPGSLGEPAQEESVA